MDGEPDGPDGASQIYGLLSGDPAASGGSEDAVKLRISGPAEAGSAMIGLGLLGMVRAARARNDVPGWAALTRRELAGREGSSSSRRPNKSLVPAGG